MPDRTTTIPLLVVIALCAVVATFWFIFWTVSAPTYHRITVDGVECIGSVSGPAGISCDWEAARA